MDGRRNNLSLFRRYTEDVGDAREMLSHRVNILARSRVDRDLPMKKELEVVHCLDMRGAKRSYLIEIEWRPWRFIWHLFHRWMYSLGAWDAPTSVEPAGSDGYLRGTEVLCERILVLGTA